MQPTRLARVADETAARSERFLGDFRATLEAVAQRPLVRAMDPANCDPALPTVRELYPRAGNILVVDPEGWILCGAKPPPGGERLRIVDMELQRAIMREGGFRLSQPLIGKISKTWGVTAVQAIRGDDGSVVGAVGMAIDLQQLQPFGTFETQDVVAGIVARPGIVIAHSVAPEQWIGKDVSDTPAVATMLAQNEGTLRATGFDQRDRLWAFRPGERHELDRVCERRRRGRDRPCARSSARRAVAHRSDRGCNRRRGRLRGPPNCATHQCDRGGRASQGERCPRRARGDLRSTRGRGCRRCIQCADRHA